MAVFSAIFFVTFIRQTMGGQSCTDYRSEHGFALVEHAYTSFIADRLAACYSACNTHPACQSFNYNLADKTCEFNNDTKYFRAKYFVEKATSIYADNPDSEAPWRKLNAAPVCFSAKDDQFGKFNVEVGGSVEAVKLIHVSGWVSCGILSPPSSNWGCWYKALGTVITTSNDVTLLPDFPELQTWYSLPGYNANSKEIVFKGLKNPLLLSSGQELRIWYSEDLQNQNENDNEGTTCADVYAMYM